MSETNDQTVRITWFSSNALLLLGVGAPGWLVGGLLWGFLMYYFVGGICWGVSCAPLFSAFMLIPLREIALRIPLKNHADLADRLAQAANRQRHTVEQRTAEIFVCKPRFGLPRLLQ